MTAEPRVQERPGPAARLLEACRQLREIKLPPYSWVADKAREDIERVAAELAARDAEVAALRAEVALLAEWREAMRAYARDWEAFLATEDGSAEELAAMEISDASQEILRAVENRLLADGATP